MTAREVYWRGFVKYPYRTPPSGMLVDFLGGVFIVHLFRKNRMYL